MQNTPYKISWSLKWLPIIVIELWLSLTIILYFLGPWIFPDVPNKYTMLCYVICGQIFIFLGYWSAVNYNSLQKIINETNSEKRSKYSFISIFYNVFTDPNKFVLICTLIVLIIETIRIVLYGLTPVQILYYMVNPGEAYRRFFDVPHLSLHPVLNMIYSPFRALSLPVTCVFWNQLSLKVKCVAILSLIVRLGFVFCCGTNMALVEIITTISLFSWIGFWKMKKLSWTNKFQYLIFISILFILFFAYFLKGSQQRWGRESVPQQIKVETFGIEPGKRYSITDSLVENNSIKSKPVKDKSVVNSLVENNSIKSKPDKDKSVAKTVFVNPNDPIKKVLPNKIYQTYLSLSNYASHGYYGLALALTCEWKPTYGFGTALWTLFALDQCFPSNTIVERCIPYQVEVKYHYRMYIAWQTIYPWVASDFSFLGALIFVGLMGRYFAITWFETLMFRNVLTPALAFQLFIGLIFVSSNNQMLQSTTGWFGFVPAFLIWFFCNKVITIKNKITESSI
jgi:hypothetical protein